MDVRVAGVGNITCRWVPDGCEPDAALVATGSHLDSVPEGGIFDGPLGVYSGVEAIRAMQDAELVPQRPIDVVAFTEEEGQRFDSGMLGSSVAAGKRSPDAVLGLEPQRRTRTVVSVEVAQVRRMDCPSRLRVP